MNQSEGRLLGVVILLGLVLVCLVYLPFILDGLESRHSNDQGEKVTSYPPHRTARY